MKHIEEHRLTFKSWAQTEKHKYLGENYARFAFCKEDEELVYAGQKLQTLIDP